MLSLSGKDPLYSQQVSQLYSIAHVGIIGSLVTSVILVMVLWNKVSYHILISWLACVVVINMGWCLLVYRYMRRARAVHDPSYWCTWFIVGNTVSGLTWGASGFWFYPLDSIPHEFFLILILGGMVAASTALYSALPQAFLAYSIPTLMPLTIRFIQQNDDLHLVMGVLSLLFLTMMTLTVQRNHHMIKGAMTLRYENAQLLEQASKARDQLESIVEARTAELEVSESRYRLLAENITDVIWVMALDGSHFTYISPSITLFRGYTPEEAMALSLEETLTPSSAQKIRMALEEELGKGQALPVNPFRSYVLELEYFRKDKSTVWGEVRGSLLRTNNGDTIGMVGVTRDLTDRKKMEKEKQTLETQLLHAQKIEAIGTLAGGIAHDFNNILTALIGYTELAMAKGSIPDGKTSYLQEVLQAGNRAKALVQQILTFSRQEDVAKEPILIQQIIMEAVQFLRATLPSTIVVRHDLDPTAGPMLADSTKIHQVIMNLGTNAGYAMRDKGGILDITLKEITVETSETIDLSSLTTGRYLCLTITDSGHGITPDVLPRIFDPFFTTKGVGEGTGMGLAATHGIVTQHGGTISVQSKPGIGTTMTIYFPRTEECLKKSSVSNPQILRGEGTILFVDDEASIVEVMKAMLGALGYHVLAYTDSHKALEVLRQDPSKIDIVITDQTMSGYTGVELAKKILHLHPSMPIILCTGFSHLINEQKALSMGIAVFLNKPYSFHQLAQAVQNIMDRKAKLSPQNA